MSVNLWNGTTLTNVGGGGGGNANVWNGTKAEWDALDHSTIKDGTQIVITDDFLNNPIPYTLKEWQELDHSDLEDGQIIHIINDYSTNVCNTVEECIASESQDDVAGASALKELADFTYSPFENLPTGDGIEGWQSPYLFKLGNLVIFRTRMLFNNSISKDVVIDFGMDVYICGNMSSNGANCTLTYAPSTKTLYIRLSKVANSGYADISIIGYKR